jgi:hypothetical protein
VISVVEHLQKVKELLSVPERWTKGAFARVVDGRGVFYNNPKACSFCLLGGICKTDPNLESRGGETSKAWHFLTMYCRRKKSMDVPNFNDHERTTHADILSFLDEAIEDAKCLE